MITTIAKVVPVETPKTCNFRLISLINSFTKPFRISSAYSANKATVVKAEKSPSASPPIPSHTANIQGVSTIPLRKIFPEDAIKTPLQKKLSSLFVLTYPVSERTVNLIFMSFEYF